MAECTGRELEDLIREHFGKEFAVETVRKARRKLSISLSKIAEEDVSSGE